MNQSAFRVDTSPGQPPAGGFSLLEVLIALLILSIGLLGIAGLQVFSLKYNHQSYERTQATVMIYDILDRMRANPQALANYDYPIPTSLSVDCAAASCSSPTDLAAYDLYMWSQALKKPGMLAGGAGTIEFLNPQLARVTVTWQEENENGAVNMSQTMTTQVF
jgi:type IV pilus assembly protein PilV